jgi:hypothetical protein
MASKKKSPLTDPDNDPVFEEVPGTDREEAEGMSVEDAYRHLAGMPPEPVIEPEEG